MVFQQSRTNFNNVATNITLKYNSSIFSIIKIKSYILGWIIQGLASCRSVKFHVVLGYYIILRYCICKAMTRPLLLVLLVYVLLLCIFFLFDKLTDNGDMPTNSTIPDTDLTEVMIDDPEEANTTLKGL